MVNNIPVIEETGGQSNKWAALCVDHQKAAWWLYVEAPSKEEAIAQCTALSSMVKKIYNVNDAITFAGLAAMLREANEKILYKGEEL